MKYRLRKGANNSIILTAEWMNGKKVVRASVGFPERPRTREQATDALTELGDAVRVRRQINQNAAGIIGGVE